MSWNRSRYDQCAYQKEISQSTSPFQWAMDTTKFYNCHDCRAKLGLVAGNNVSVTKNNMVDVESDLFGITRQSSLCPERKFIPHCHQCSEMSGIPCKGEACQNVNSLQHLPECQNSIVEYGPRINHVGYHLEYPKCSEQKGMKYPPQFNPIKYQ